MKNMLRSLTLSVLGLAILSAADPAAATISINFDAPADGTVIDTYYVLPLDTSFSFVNPVGPASVYARSSLFNTSPGNVVSIHPTGIPAFNAAQGAVDAIVNTVLLDSVIIVTVMAAPVASLEPLGTPLNRPFMEVYDQSNTFLGRVTWQGALPTNPLQVGAWQRLTFKMAPCVGSPIQCAGYGIGKVRLSSQSSQGGPNIYALFDDLVANPVTCSNLLVINGDGSSCNRTISGDACTTWTCPVGYTPTSADPVCNGGTWSGPAVCTADACYGEPLIPFGSSTGCVGLPNGSTCTTWTCDPGYVAMGSDPLCVDGGWSGDFGCYDTTSVPLLPGAGSWLLPAVLAAPAAVWLGRGRRRPRSS